MLLSLYSLSFGCFIQNSYSIGSFVLFSNLFCIIIWILYCTHGTFPMSTYKKEPNTHTKTHKTHWILSEQKFCVYLLHNDIYFCVLQIQTILFYVLKLFWLQLLLGFVIFYFIFHLDARIQGYLTKYYNFV